MTLLYIGDNRYIKNLRFQNQLIGPPKNSSLYHISYFYLCCYREANDQKFKKKDGDTANQLRKAIAVADMNLVQ